MNTSNNNINLKEKEEPIIKNICYNNQTGQLILIDNKTKQFLCDIFGRKKTKFIPSISGIANAIERNNYPLTSRNSDSKGLLTDIFSSKKKISNQKQYKDYLPTTRKLEGYMKFPRPIVPPYSNLSANKTIEKNREKIKNCLNKHFSYEKNKKYMEKRNENKGLSYLTNNLNEYDTLKHNSQRLLKVIENTFNEYKEKYKYKLNKLKNDPTIKALVKFEKYILNNKESKLINGRKLKEYDPKIKEEYNIINSILHGKTLANETMRRNNLSLKGNKTVGKIKTIPKLKFDLLKNRNISNDNMKTICSNRDLTIGRKIKMNFGIFSYEEEARKKEENLKKIENYFQDKEKDESKEIENFKINNLVEKENNLDENDIKQQNEFSFISLDKEKEKNSKKYKIKYMNKLQSTNENEKNLLKGFNREEPKQEKLFFKSLKPKLKTNAQLYIEDLELLKKTNPFVYKMEEKKEKRDLKQLEKKIEALKINANNLMKIKLNKRKIKFDK